MSFDETREIQLDEVKVVTEQVVIKKKDWMHQMFWDAAQYIKRNGWTQNRYENPVNGAVCILGAFRKILNINDSTVYNDNLFKLDRCFTNSIKQDTTIYEWNDKSGRTKEEVISTLETIAND